MAHALIPPLVTTQWVADRLGQSDLVLLDATWFLPGQSRNAKDEYASRHIPSAGFFDIDSIRDKASALPHMLPSPAVFATAARRLGVNAASWVVVYDALGLFSAPRAWWSFRAMGHEASVVMDGGLPKWLAEGRPTESGWRIPTRGDFKARYRSDLVRDLTAVKSALATGVEQIVDARPAARFQGRAPEPRPGLRGGHMPRARSVPYAELITDEGALRPEAEIAAAFASAGVNLERPVVTTCGSGVSAAVLALALAQIGRADVAIYDGSWAEWGASDEAIASGEAVR